MRKILGSLLLLSGLVILAWQLRSCQQFRSTARGKPVIPSRIEPDQRSLLLITVDTTRADHLEPYGAESVSTPTLSRLANDGILMERVFSVAPLTLPAHTSILTGLYPPQHGVRNNGLHYVPANLDTLAESLSAEGYRTAAFVSAAVLDRRFGLDQGFELYDDDLSAGRARYPRMVADRPAEAVVKSASTWLNSIGTDESFFAWVHFYDPHAAYNPPPPFRDEYRERLYDGEIAYMDDQIGKLLDHPRLRAEQSLVVSVVGDHGESLGDHGENTHGIMAYRSTLNVPWIIWIRGHPQGLRIPTATSLVDVYPTLAHLVGIKPTASMAGRNLFAAKDIDAAAQPGTIYSESYLPYYTYGWSKLKVVRQWPWELIDSTRPELYDLRRDPSELTNLFEQRPEIAHDMTQLLAETAATFGEAGELAHELEIDHQAIDRLRALGYLAMTSTPSTAEADRPAPADLVHVHVALERGRQLMANQLWEQARDQFERVLSEDPNNLAALIELASALRGEDRLDDAVDTAERVLQLEPNHQQTLLLLAAMERERGATDRALEVVDAAIAVDPRNPAGWAQKCLQLLASGQRDEAADAIRNGLDYDPSNPLLNALFAFHVHAAANDLDTAEAGLVGVVAADPFLGEGWRFLGVIYERQGELDKAEATYRQGLERVPDDEQLHAHLAILLASTSGPEAETHLREAIRLASTFRSELHVALGAWLAEHGRTDEATREYDLVLEVQPDHPAARNNRAVALARKGRSDEALNELRALTSEYPDYADAHNNMAAIAVFLRQWSTAERHARRTLEIDENIVEAWDNLGVALQEQGELQSALEAFDTALEKNPQYWQSLVNRGLTLVELEQWTDARKDLEAVLEYRPRLPDAHLALGDIYADELDDPDRARKHYQAFLKRAPNHPRASEIEARIGVLLARAATTP